jgi:hypothetical protein
MFADVARAVQENAATKLERSTQGSVVVGALIVAAMSWTFLFGRIFSPVKRVVS